MSVYATSRTIASSHFLYIAKIPFYTSFALILFTLIKYSQMISQSPNKTKVSPKMTSSQNKEAETDIKGKTTTRESTNRDFASKISVLTNNQETASSPKRQDGLIVTPVKQYKSKQSIQVGEKSPIQLMQDILKGARQQHEVISSYYSSETEQFISDLLTNKYKRNNYISNLEKKMDGLSPAVCQNYQLLALLLQQTSKGDIQVKHQPLGMQLSFNQTIIDEQEILLQKLRQQKQAKQQEIRDIVHEYEGIIGNFNEIISKMVNKNAERDQRQMF